MKCGGLFTVVYTIRTVGPYSGIYYTYCRTVEPQPGLFRARADTQGHAWAPPDGAD